MNARITKFNVLRNIKDQNWSNKLLDVIKLTTASILMLISKCNANIKRRSLKKLLQEYNRLDYVVSEKRAKTIAGVFRSNISKLGHQKLQVGRLLKLRED